MDEFSQILIIVGTLIVVIAVVVVVGIKLENDGKLRHKMVRQNVFEIRQNVFESSFEDEISFEDNFDACCSGIYNRQYGWWDSQTIFSNTLLLNSLTKKYESHNLGRMGIGEGTIDPLLPHNVLKSAKAKNLYIVRDRSHIYAILYNKSKKKKSSTVVIDSSSGPFPAFVESFFPKGTKFFDSTEIARQSDAASCGPFTFYNLFREYFDELGVEIKSGSKANSIQTEQIQIISLAFKELNRFLEQDFKNILPCFCNEIVDSIINDEDAANKLIMLQKDLLQKCAEAENRRDFSEAFDDYMEEIKYWFSNELVDFCENQADETNDQKNHRLLTIINAGTDEEKENELQDNRRNLDNFMNNKLPEIQKFCKDFEDSKEVNQAVVYTPDVLEVSLNH